MKTAIFEKATLKKKNRKTTTRTFVLNSFYPTNWTGRSCEK